MSVFEPVRYAALTDVGVKRSHNQDACAAQPAADALAWQAHGHVFVVADGMGGHAVGEKASAKAVRDIPFLYIKHAKDGIVPALRRAFQEANAGIYTIGQENPEFRGMGTTSTAMVLRPEGAWFGHVGDSRAYRIRGEQIEQLTFDHSWVWEIARRQGIDPDELGDFKKNVIIRSLGPDPEVEVDIEGPHPVRPGDSFLICSDGLSNQVTADEMGAVVGCLPTDEAAKFLIELANLRGGPDNITVAIIQTGGSPDDEAPRLNKSRSGPSLPQRLAAKWSRWVPWPFTLLGLGSILAVLSLAMHIGEVGGAIPLFILSTLVIIGGLVGLILFFRSGQANLETSDDMESRPLNAYKTYSCQVTEALLGRLSQLEKSLFEAMKAQETPTDWDAYQKAADAAEAEVKKGISPAAFRARCKSLGFLAQSFNKSRHKEESFRPSWTTK